LQKKPGTEYYKLMPPQIEENRHIPVLLNATLDAFESIAHGQNTIVDCTLGGAGHSFALLERFREVRLLGCDTDPAAIERAQKKLATFVTEQRVAFHHGNFSTLIDLDTTKLPVGFGPPWNGALLDLGYSSNQLEDPTYGMSFMLDAPIDMRLSLQGPSAWDLLQDATDQELGDILKAYGEIIGAHRLASRIRQAIHEGEITNSTASLAGFIERISGGRKRDEIHPATLVFQALRIAVNDELRVLDHFLEGVILKLRPQARIAVISFHSLEDRLVKRWGQKHEAELRAVTKKPIVAESEEIKLNPRSRSAKLRVYEKKGN
jgi:16S rRNA (cytosine1402-N4)-methyltransferase